MIIYFDVEYVRLQFRETERFVHFMERRIQRKETENGHHE